MAVTKLPRPEQLLEIAFTNAKGEDVTAVITEAEARKLVSDIERVLTPPIKIPGIWPRSDDKYPHIPGPYPTPTYPSHPLLPPITCHGTDQAT